ncbi:MAG: HD domain-containing protein [Bacteroidales bacterium]
MITGYSKRKILNDPIYGFIKFPFEIIYQIMDHPWFQRLRRIKQTGLTSLVYPGANHSRFQHSLGAMHLMQEAIKVLRIKGHSINKEEERGALIAIMLHDIGHGPFSHSLENSIVDKLSHEDLSEIFMQFFNEIFRNELDLALEIFKDKYSKKFLHQLVSSQLDVDRLDYLKRDSFYTGVVEGTVNADRIISMLELAEGELAVESKGIYSVEQFIIARRLMYWQVYLHKAVIASEYLLVSILKRAKFLVETGVKVWSTPSLSFFLTNQLEKKDFNEQKVLQRFSELDDYDVLASIKVWASHKDKVLSYLAKSIINRSLGAIELRDESFSEEDIDKYRKKTMQILGFTRDEVDYVVINDFTFNLAYNPNLGRINILNKKGITKDISLASDQLNISVLSNPVTKSFLIYPKEIR